ncbi:MAG: hypothetical protein IJ744_07645 [Lachnospiraceae bacterium]|nr:hypothetical protein [Lachnospiraceae bacterium]
MARNNSRRSARNDENVVRYQKPIRINIGLIVFSLIFIYMLVNIIIYMGRDKIAIYEVSKLSIADDNTVRGLALREETVYSAGRAGYINFLYQEGSQVYKNSPVYTVDESGSVYNILSASEGNVVLSDTDIDKVRASIKTFQNSYSSDHYEKLTNLQYDLSSDIMDITNAAMMDRLEEILGDSANTTVFSQVRSTSSGIISYTIDGMEDLKLENLKKSDFDSSDYASKVQNTRTAELVGLGDSVYKLSKSENWQIVIPLTKDQQERLTDVKTISITFMKDHVDAKASVELTEIEGSPYAILSLSRFMVRYVNDRYLDIELHLNQVTGLKIPVTALTTKDFYVVPNDYYVTDEGTGATGVYVQTYSEEQKAVVKEFVDMDIYMKDEENFYIAAAAIEGGTVLLPTDDAETTDSFVLAEKAALTGVFNVNKGYYIFRQVEVLYQNEEYCIVAENTPYGLSAYDHIVADATGAVEDAVIY